MGLEVETFVLPVGDYETNECLFERKEVKDLASSIKDGRLFSQLYRMSRAKKIPFLLIHGDLFDVRPQMRKPVLHAVASAVVRYKVSVVWVDKLQKALYLMVQIATKIHEGKYGVPHVIKKRVVHRDERVVALSKALGIPVRVAENLLEMFGSIAGVCQASEKDLMLVSGIGEIRAKRIYSLLHSEVKPSD